MAFYAAFPLLAGLGEILARRSWVLVGAAAVIATIANVALASALKRVGVEVSNNTFFFFGLWSQLPAFLLGMAAYHRLEMNDALRATRSRVLAVMGAVTFFAITAALLWSGRRDASICMVLAAALASVFLLNALRDTPSLPEWLCRIGRVSFSMYVFHFVFVWYVAEAILPWLLPLRASLRLILVFVGGSACTYIVARVTEQLVEQHGIRAGERLIQRR